MKHADSEVLRKIRLGTHMSLANLLKKIGKAPPLAVLNLLYRHDDFEFSENLLEHADGLDFFQDTLTATGDSL